MKKILVAMALVLMTAGTAMAHGGVNFQIGLGIPLYYPYSYPSYYYPAPPYGYSYPTPPAFYGYGPVYDPFFGTINVHRGFGHRHFIERGGRFHNNHFRFDHGRRFGR